jgi:hypothetical protein
VTTSSNEAGPGKCSESHRRSRLRVASQEGNRHRTTFEF